MPVDATAKQLASLIKSRRKELNISQEELSSLTQVAIRTIRDMEKGKANPSLSTMQQVMEILGIDLDFKLK
jgi:transcriptional regulator with XRE-family HTH domain